MSGTMSGAGIMGETKKDRVGDATAATVEGRRGFLRSLGVASAAGAAAVATGGSTAEAAESPEEQAKGRYQDNDYVKNFYHLNRL